MKTMKDIYDNISISPQRKEILLNQLLNQPSSKQSSFKNTKLLLSIITVCIIMFIAAFHISTPSTNQVIFTSPKNTSQTNCTLDSISYDISNQELQNLNFFIYNNIRVYNQDILDSFIKDINNHQSSHIRIAITTDEGDPILTEVYYHPQNGVTIYYDTTRDRFGQQTLTQYHYQKIGVYENTLYAYNNELNQQTIDNHETFSIVYILLQ